MVFILQDVNEEKKIASFQCDFCGRIFVISVGHWIPYKACPCGAKSCL